MNTNRAPRGREREVVRSRREQAAVLPPGDLVLRPGRTRLRDRLGRHGRRERVDSGKWHEGAEQIDARAEKKRERARDPDRPAGRCAGEACEHDEQRQSGQEQARSPSRLSVPRPPGGCREKKRDEGQGECESEPPVPAKKSHEAERCEENDRRVPEEALVRKDGQPQEAREEGIRERLPRVPAEELAEAGELEKNPEKKDS